MYDGSVSPYTVRWDDTDDLSGGLTLEDVDAISDAERQEREAKYAPIFAQREEEVRKKQEEEERKKREEEEKEGAKHALFEAAKTGELSEMTRLLRARTR